MLSKNNIALNTISTTHRKFDSQGQQISLEEFDIDDEESDGTKKIFALSSLLIDTLKNAKILIIDEFDARLHPLMSRSIVELFNSNGTNPHNAQLIFMTHDTNLLSNKIFRRDQIWFTEKDRYGATALYSLAEYKVRNDASFESDYIKGKYGAIPYIQVAESFIEAHA
jgi:AAA15 family ATPase/GTPase